MRLNRSSQPPGQHAHGVRHPSGPSLWGIVHHHVPLVRRFSVQLFSGEEFTGFTNKPWGNDVAFNRQQLQGTWADKDGRLAWVQAQLTIERFWTSTVWLVA